jgi:hypothetical protein
MTGPIPHFGPNIQNGRAGGAPFARRGERKGVRVSAQLTNRSATGDAA